MEILNKTNENLDNRKSKRMEILKTTGALDEYQKLQSRNITNINELENLKNKINEINSAEQELINVQSSRLELKKAIKRDYEDTKPEWEKSVALFDKNVQALYQNSGNLIISPTKTGYKFDTQIPRDNSKGISQMKIFCYDLMLVELFSEKKLINFLVHDSNIYDGVDPRQTSFALQQAQLRGNEKNFQYICTMNRDSIPYEFLDSKLDVNKYIRKTLKDTPSTDFLLGFEFEL